MPQKSPIEWTDYTSNPIYAVNTETGKRGWFCVKVSPGCGHCYSETLNVGRLGNKLHFTENNLDKVEFVLNENELVEIFKLNNRLAKKGETAKMFLMDMSDLFLDAIPDEYIDKIFAVAALCPNITFQILTKRAERMWDYSGELTYYRKRNHCRDWAELLAPILNKSVEILWDSIHSNIFQKDDNATFSPNVWLGVSCENQQTADKRIPLLLQTPAAIRFLSCEPLLGEIDLKTVGCPNCGHSENDWFPNYVFCRHCKTEVKFPPNSIDWVIVGGESGNNARPCDLDWIRSIVKHCKASDVKCFVKQLGKLPIRKARSQNEILCENYLTSKGINDAPKGFLSLAISDKKGGDINEFPDDLKIRQMPI